MTVGRKDLVATPRLPDAIVRGIRELDDVAGYRRRASPFWHETAAVWVLPFELRVPVAPDAAAVAPVPEITPWVVLVSASYPHGAIEIYPAANGGITETFPHQSVNGPPKQGQDWRRGKLCVDSPFATFGRTVYGGEPRDAASRLTYHLSRAQQWVEAVRCNALLQDGEPFELPVYAQARTSQTVVFESVAASVSQWSGSVTRSGLATLVTPVGAARLRVLASFDRKQAGGNATDLPVPQWGAHLGAKTARAREEVAVWVRLERLPVTPPWTAPATWGELEDCLNDQGLDLLEIMRAAAPSLRTGRRHLLLLGAPIPVHVGESPKAMHWLAVQLPTLSFGKQVKNGFRRGEDGRWLRDRQEVLRSSMCLTWISSENWSPDQIATRGRADAALRNARVALIGAGALGSALAELLVREGVHRLIILDPDTLEAGNLVRHTLSVHEVGRDKAAALAERLNSLSPHAEVTAIASHFPGGKDGTDALRDSDLVIDCTANDALAYELGAFEWGASKRFVSCAVGLHAKRLFLYLVQGPEFSVADFADRINPWILLDRDEFQDSVMPWDGIGCWHPVFPARASDFGLFAAVLVRRLEAFMQQEGHPSVLTVLERVVREDGTTELHESALRENRQDA